MNENKTVYGKVILSKSKNAKKRAIKNEITGWLIGGWPFIGSMLFGIFPTVMGFVLPFCSVEGTNLNTLQFVGLRNFKYLLISDPYKYFWLGLKNSALYLFSVPIDLSIALLVAVELDKKVKGVTTYRILMFLPNFISAVAMSLFWRFVFANPNGVFNSFLGIFGLKPVAFLTTELTYLPSVIFTTTWGACANCVLFQAALANVDESMKEAARIDGATERQIFWKITFSAISPTTFYQFLMSLIGALQVFTSLQLLSEGSGMPTGPNNAGLSMVYYIYEMTFEWMGPGSGLGMATACGKIYQVLLGLMTIVVFRTSKKWVYYENE